MKNILTAVVVLLSLPFFSLAYYPVIVQDDSSVLLDTATFGKIGTVSYTFNATTTITGFSLYYGHTTETDVSFIMDSCTHNTMGRIWSLPSIEISSSPVIYSTSSIVDSVTVTTGETCNFYIMGEYTSDNPITNGNSDDEMFLVLRTNATTTDFVIPTENEVYITSPEAGEVTASSTVDIDFKYYVSLPGDFVLYLESYETCLGSPEQYKFYLNTDTLGISTASFENIQLEENKTYWATIRYVSIFEDEGDPTEGISSPTVLFHVVSTSTEYTTETSAFMCSIGRMENRLKYKIPWGYYFLFEEKIEEMKEATSTQIIAPLASLTATDTFGHLDFPDFTLLDTSWFSQESDFFGPIWDEWMMLNNIIGWLLWVLFGVWVYRLANRKEDTLQ